MPRQTILEERDDTRDVWKRLRKGFVTASDFFNFARLGPSYWPDRRPEVLAEKLRGTPRVFGNTPEDIATAERRMAHGRENEEHNLRKMARNARLRVRPAHYFITNDRWPWLGATLDGIVARPNNRVEIQPEIFTQPDHVQSIRDRLMFMSTRVGICELKQHDETAKRRAVYFGHTKRNGIVVPAMVPETIIPQVQGQMHIADFEWSIVAAQIGASNMQIHLVERDPQFADVLDDINDTFQAELAEHRRMIWG